MFMGLLEWLHRRRSRVNPLPTMWFSEQFCPSRLGCSRPCLQIGQARLLSFIQPDKSGARPTRSGNCTQVTTRPIIKATQIPLSADGQPLQTSHLSADACQTASGQHAISYCCQLLLSVGDLRTKFVPIMSFQSSMSEDIISYRHDNLKQ